MTADAKYVADLWIENGRVNRLCYRHVLLNVNKTKQAILGRCRLAWHLGGFNCCLRDKQEDCNERIQDEINCPLNRSNADCSNFE